MKPLFIATTTLLAFASVGTHSTLWRTAHYENVLGTSMEIKTIAVSEAAADRAEAAALGEIKRLNGILSGYDPNSEFSRWAKTENEPISVSPELMEVLKLWDSWRARSSGALNPAAETIIREWKQAETSGKLPFEKSLASAVEAASVPQWRLEGNSATRLTVTPLMLNSFTKSYIIQRGAEAALREPGISSVVLNIGGDLVIRGTGSDNVSVTDPLSSSENSDPIAVLNVRDRAVATSGNYRRGFEIGGEHYSHIVDPRTGHAADDIVGATVVAPNAVDAGALATALCVLSPEESRKLAASVPGAEYVLMAKNGVRYVSAGWNSLPAAPAYMLAAAPQTKSAASGHELTINIEIPQTQGFGARRPYVAIWIEDKDHYPVRTIAVLFEKARWLNELRAWYRDDRLRAMSEGTEILNSVTSATRSPGKYTFKWDGKDNSGKPVKDGAYTVMVEAAREHGGDSVVRKEIVVGGEPVQAQLPPGGELGTVTLDYHKVSH